MKLNKNTILVAEIGQAHDGSLGSVHSYIDALKEIKIDAIKFQIHYADAESSKYEKFRIKFSYQDKSRYDYWKRIEFTENQWSEIKRHCEYLNIKFVASPFSIKSVDVLKKLNTKFYKIASGETNNFLMIDKIRSLNQNIILSSGLSNINELKKTFKRLDKNKTSILQCTSHYPTKPENIGLNIMEKFRKLFKVPVGLSDHSGNKNTILAAASLGADIIEFHVTFSKKSFGPDNSSSIEINELGNLVDGVRYINKIINNKVDKDKVTTKLSKVKKIFGKSLAINCDLKKDSKIMIDYLESKKPSGMGISSSFYESIIGKKLNKSLTKGSFINWSDLKK